MTQIRIERYDIVTDQHTISRTTVKKTRSDNLGFKADHQGAVCKHIINSENEVMVLATPYESEFITGTANRVTKKGQWLKVGRYETYSGVGGVAFFGPSDVKCLWAKAGRQTEAEFMEMHDK